MQSHKRSNNEVRKSKRTLMEIVNVSCATLHGHQTSQTSRLHAQKSVNASMNEGASQGRGVPPIRLASALRFCRELEPTLQFILLT